MSNKGPCIHGNLCREYWNKFHVIYSTRCPECDRYEPKLQRIYPGTDIDTIKNYTYDDWVKYYIMQGATESTAMSMAKDVMAKLKLIGKLTKDCSDDS